MMFYNLLMTLTNVVNGLYFANHEVYFTDHQKQFSESIMFDKTKITNCQNKELYFMNFQSIIYRRRHVT